MVSLKWEGNWQGVWMEQVRGLAGSLAERVNLAGELAGRMGVTGRGLARGRKSGRGGGRDVTNLAGGLAGE